MKICVKLCYTMFLLTHLAPDETFKEAVSFLELGMLLIRYDGPKQNISNNGFSDFLVRNSVLVCIFGTQFNKIRQNF